MRYELVFDASQKWPAFDAILIGLLMMGFFAALWRYWDSPWLKRLPSGPLEKYPVFRRRWSRLISAVFFTLSLLWTVGVTVNVFSQYFEARSALRSGQLQVVEGVVEHFSPMPRSGEEEEHFTVQGVPFSFSAHSISQGFNQPRLHGGPLHEGVPVRLHYITRGERNVILRVEVGTPGKSQS